MNVMERSNAWDARDPAQHLATVDCRLAVLASLLPVAVVTA